MTYDVEHDCFVGAFPMPASIKAYIRYVGADRFIYINAGLSEDAQRKAYEHELMHLMRDDLNAEDPVRVIEDTVHHLVENGNQDVVSEVSTSDDPNKDAIKAFSDCQFRISGDGTTSPFLSDLEMACITIRDVRRGII